MSEYDPEFLTLCDEVLKQGREVLGLPTGIVSRIEDPFYTVVAVVSPSVVFNPGDSFSLVDTYCREVCEQRAAVAYTHYHDEPGLRKHPLYIDMPIEAYISVPLLVGGKVWGTLNFSDTEIRTEPFSDSDLRMVEGLAERLTRALQAGE